MLFALLAPTMSREIRYPFSPKNKWLSYLLLIYTVIIIITNILFIPVYGIIGAAIASLISRVIYGL
jgi:O-antigen/teichoic acid export membrane protein